LAERRTEGLLADAVIRGRIFHLGPVVFDEGRAVLLQMNLLPPTADQADTFIEFTAVSLERSRFAPSSLLQLFPGLPAGIDLQGVLIPDVDVDQIFEFTRLDGAADPDSDEPRDAGVSNSDLAADLRLEIDGQEGCDNVRSEIANLQAPMPRLQPPDPIHG